MSERFFMGKTYYVACADCESAEMSRSLVGDNDFIEICQGCGAVDSEKEVSEDEHERLTQ